MQTINNWIKTPNENVVALFVTLWLVATSLLILAMTDLFRESFFQRKNFMLYFLLGWSTFSIVKLYFNFRKTF